MELTLTAAANLTGKGKSTLLRAVKSGKLSSRKTDDGTFMVDASELARVFPIKALERVSDAAVTHHDTPRSEGGAGDAVRDAELVELRVKVARLEERLEGREGKIAEQREALDDLRKRLDDEQAERRALQRQITSQVNQAQGARTTQGFLDRLRRLVRPQAG